MSPHFKRTMLVKITFSSCIALELESLFIILKQYTKLIYYWILRQKIVFNDYGNYCFWNKVFQSNILLPDYPQETVYLRIQFKINYTWKFIEVNVYLKMWQCQTFFFFLHVSKHFPKLTGWSKTELFFFFFPNITVNWRKVMI